MKLFWCLAFLATLSCSTQIQKTKNKTFDEAERAEAPEWVYAADKACPPSEVCAAGEGESLQQADLRARKAMASIFQTHIASQLNARQTSFSSSEIDELKEMVEIQTQETVEGILKAVEIKKRFHKEGLFFALASLNKRKASQSLQREISVIDQELEHLFQGKKKSAIKRILTLLEKRRHLDDKMIVLRGESSKAAYTVADALNIKYASKGHKKVFVKAAKNAPSILVKQFEELLAETGYKTQRDSAVDYILEVGFSAKETYLNVKGFKKFAFAFSVEAKNNLNERIGSFVVNNEQTGRNQQDAFLKTKGYIQEQMEKNFNLLNLK